VRLHAEAGAGREQVRQALGRIDSRSGTRLYDAVALLVGTRMQASSERQALVLLTDGVDTRSRLADAQSTLRLIGESHVPVYAIQYDTRRSESPLPWGGRVNGRGIRDMTSLILPDGALDNSELFARADAYLASLTEMSGGRLYRAESLLDLNQALTQVVKDSGRAVHAGLLPDEPGSRRILPAIEGGGEPDRRDGHGPRGLSRTVTVSGARGSGRVRGKG
jgi:hypothetical protein